MNVIPYYVEKILLNVRPENWEKYGGKFFLLYRMVGMERKKKGNDCYGYMRVTQMELEKKDLTATVNSAL